MERKLSTTVNGQTVELFVHSTEMSSNYLQFIGADVIAGTAETDSEGIVINRALADRLLEPGQTYADLPGTTLSYLAPFAVQTQIRGVIQNLPHRGVAAAPMLMMYTQLKVNGWGPHDVLTLTTNPKR